MIYLPWDKVQHNDIFKIDISRKQIKLTHYNKKTEVIKCRNVWLLGASVIRYNLPDGVNLNKICKLSDWPTTEALSGHTFLHFIPSYIISSH